MFIMEFYALLFYCLYFYSLIIFLTLFDFHLSTISIVLATTFVFIAYDIFKTYARKVISKRLIKKAWNNHFPYFAYEKYSKIAEEIYKQALKDEISKASLEKYVLEKIGMIMR